ncbi:MAG: nucleoside hydrolase [Xanthomonadales bacterium]|nr:nucleoside hydrolase [Xanthomonadales bacterium]
MIEAQPVIIDCDPGQDDAVMLLLAMASPELDILGITTVAGNVPLALTQRNARIMTDLAGRTDIPVFAGCERPLQRELVTAEYVHGKTGIDGAPIQDPVTPLQETHAVDFIIETLLASPENTITLVPTGPLTNIAAAIQREPRILAHIRHIVLMGGALREGGNTTTSAEFNIYVDPHAADTVLHCGRPITIVPLDVSHQALVTPGCLKRLRALNSRVARATVGMLEFFNRFDSHKYGTEGAPLHDPCTIAWLLRPGLFRGKRCNVEIETESALTLGHTAVDFWHVSDRPENAEWLYSIDAEGFFDLLVERIGRYE